MQKKIVILDVDGVCADFTELYLRCMKEALGHAPPVESFIPRSWKMHEALDLTEEMHQMVDQVLYKPGMASSMRLLPGAKEGVKQLMEVAEVFFVTAPVQQSPTWVYDRNRWIDDIFGDDVSRRVHYTDHKYMVCGDIFVDDKVSTIVDWRKAWPSRKAVLWPQPYNELPEDHELVPHRFNESHENNWLRLFQAVFHQ